MSRNDLHFKVVMVGDSGVGKTALVNRISEGAFVNVHVPTVGSQFITLNLEIENTKIVLELWDTAGQEVYRSLVGFYTREAKGAFLVCDITNKTSFDGLADWITFITDAAPGVKIILFANKIDLPDRLVSTEMLHEFARSHNLEVFEGSAKTGENTTNAFERMGELLLQNQRASNSDPRAVNPGKNLEEKGEKKKGCCK
ncbi:Ras-related protein Rab-13 [Tritrichomonas foetus]|uniref:Ras-related protein Rab-13 n=1 Tax=Tritrichomonas foetus TaxID=1144522 RepID=A0A1J4JTJ1_9EUKA|nr:Ras-related protein Rab-13 [Tritrichomonas foetus]|eukprot:OHT02441.1 Ras-related protein Rab-13 [Tritrichomonas foetus]